MRTTGLLPIEQAAMEASAKQFDEAREEVLQEVIDFFEERVPVDLQDTPIWHRYRSGDTSFCDDLVLCTSQAQRVITGGNIETGDLLQNTLKELLTHTVAWLAWRRVVDKQTPTTGFTKPVDDCYATSTIVPLSAVGLKDPDAQGEYEIPERPPDTTGPKPRRGLFGRRPSPDVDTSVELPTSRPGGQMPPEDHQRPDKPTPAPPRIEQAE